MLSAVTSCLSTCGKIMPAWPCWQRGITVVLAQSFYRNVHHFHSSKQPLVHISENVQIMQRIAVYVVQ